MKVPAAKATAGPIIMSATAPTATPPERVALATSMMWIRLRLKFQEMPHPVNVLGSPFTSMQARLRPPPSRESDLLSEECRDDEGGGG